MQIAALHRMWWRKNYVEVHRACGGKLHHALLLWTPCIGPALGASLTLSVISTLISAGMLLATV